MSDTATSAAEGGAIETKAAFADGPWDAASAVASVRKWASSDGSGSKDTISWGKYAKAFLWHQDGAEDFGGYKLPVAKAEGGKLVVVKAALRAAASVLGGGRGGVDIPEGDLAGVKAKLARLEEEAGVGEGEGKSLADLPPLPPAKVKCMGGKLAVGSHVRHVKSGMCGEVKSMGDDGMVDVDEHDDKCAPTGTMKSYSAKSLAAIDDDGDEDDGTEEKRVKAAKPREGSAEEEAEETPVEEAAEDMDEDDEDTEAGGFRRGDHVHVKAPHFSGPAMVKSVHRKGIVPDVDNDMEASKDDPAARVKCYKPMNGGHMPTEIHKGVKCRHMTKMVEPMQAPSKPKAAPPAKAKDGSALPPLVALTPEQEIEAALSSLTPDALRKGFAAELDRRMGVV